MDGPSWLIVMVMVMVTWAELLEPTTRAFLPFHEASFSVELLCTISPLQHTKHSAAPAE